VPVWAVLFGHDWGFLFGLAAFGLSVVSYFPTLRRYGQSRWWALALPAIAVFYMAATIVSALRHWRGEGAVWKSRAYP
jgi:hypothetical protein